MSTCNTFTKDPDAQLDYAVDWSAFLTGSEVITTSSWEVPVGLTNVLEEATDTIATVWLADGDIGETYTLVNSIETDSTPVRKDDRSFMVRVEQK